MSGKLAPVPAAAANGKSNPILIAASNDIIAEVREQTRSLLPVSANPVALNGILQQLNNLKGLLNVQPGSQIDTAIADAIAHLTAVLAGKEDQAALGFVLGDLNTLVTLVPATSNLTGSQQVSSVLKQVQALLTSRPDVSSILDDLEAIKTLKGGPADATAFHDFHVLQIAFKSIWMHLLDGNLHDAAELLYEEAVRLYDQTGVPMPAYTSIDDIDQLQSFISDLSATIAPPVTPASMPVDPNAIN